MLCSGRQILKGEEEEITDSKETALNTCTLPYTW
jgi:hypothetical protein